MNSFSLKTKIILAVLIFLFAFFIWPTPYKYMEISITGTNTSKLGLTFSKFPRTVRGGRYPVRINRITGETQVLGLGGWRSLGRP